MLKYLQEEGCESFVIRGFNLYGELSLPDHFERLPDDYIVSSLPGSPKKSSLNNFQRDQILHRLSTTQKTLNQISPIIENIEIQKHSLKNEIVKKIESDDAIGTYFHSDGERLLFVKQLENVVSRSQWYEFIDNYFAKTSSLDSNRFKSEVIDPSYNSLFAIEGEGFLQDDIKVINNVPEILLDSSVVFKSFRNEIQYIEYPLKVFEFITSFGSGEIAKFLTDEALGYIEDKFSDKGEKYLSRKNWFGMYDVMKRKIGLEVK
ncbi:hypothetical protein ACOI22_00620 [Glaciecola sp. 2405UD65-10]|uniref:hypothetical protein n=1 Tax=Glaciecola sp. 2405UD65-10 TaxID=3397244 RepID=UPI003B591DAD